MSPNVALEKTVFISSHVLISNDEETERRDRQARIAENVMMTREVMSESICAIPRDILKV